MERVARLNRCSTPKNYRSCREIVNVLMVPRRTKNIIFNIKKHINHIDITKKRLHKIEFVI
jgi:hypothetical protein